MVARKKKKSGGQDLPQNAVCCEGASGQGAAASLQVPLPCLLRPLLLSVLHPLTYSPMEGNLGFNSILQWHQSFDAFARESEGLPNNSEVLHRILAAPKCL